VEVGARRTTVTYGVLRTEVPSGSRGVVDVGTKPLQAELYLCLIYATENSLSGVLLIFLWFLLFSLL